MIHLHDQGSVFDLPNQILYNKVFHNHDKSDTYKYLEVEGLPTKDLGSKSILVISIDNLILY